MAGNGGVIGPPNTVTQIFKDKVTTFTSSGTFNKATANPAAPGNATVEQNISARLKECAKQNASFIKQ